MKRPDLLAVLLAWRALDAAGDVDAERLHAGDGHGDIVRREAAGEDRVAASPVHELVREVPVRELSGAAQRAADVRVDEKDEGVMAERLREVVVGTEPDGLDEGLSDQSADPLHVVRRLGSVELDDVGLDRRHELSGRRVREVGDDGNDLHLAPHRCSAPHPRSDLCGALELDPPWRARHEIQPDRVGPRLRRELRVLDGGDAADLDPHRRDSASIDLEELLHLGDHLRSLDRLGDVCVRAELERALPILLRAFGGDDDDPVCSLCTGSVRTRFSQLQAGP